MVHEIHYASLKKIGEFYAAIYKAIRDPQHNYESQNEIMPKTPAEVYSLLLNE
jgi:hypothetical protein